MTNELVFRGAGDVIRRHRTERELTLEQLALAAGMDKGQIAKFESNKVGLCDTKLRSLAAAFGMKPEVLSYECLMAVRPELLVARVGQLMGNIVGQTPKKPLPRKPKKPTAKKVRKKTAA
jgi:transcriptional regulator with XRE-family HTH domain